jgi:hypothetical protein
VKHSRRLHLEHLEDRLTPTVNLTVSFVPDGTVIVPGKTSQMFAALNTMAPTASWESDVLKDLHGISALSNAVFTIVPDGGEALSTTGAVHDSRFGDIRIAMGLNATGAEETYLSTRYLFSGPSLIDPSALPTAPPTTTPSSPSTPSTYLPSILDLGTYQWGRLFAPLGNPVGMPTSGSTIPGTTSP